MHECFAQITPHWLERAYLYNGSIGPAFHDFRYRLEQDVKAGVIHAAAYSDICYELAEDREERDFPWNEEGTAQLRDWLQERYEAYLNLLAEV